MPYLQGRCAPPESALVPLGKLQRRFYEPILLLLALTQACMHNRAPRAPELVNEALSHSPEELFKDFVNKLCQICDNTPGGGAVTAMSVLQYPDCVQYRFASNQRSENDLLKVKSYLHEILETLKGYPAKSSAIFLASILRKVVAFNRPRLQVYVRNLSKQIWPCIEAPKVPTELSDKLKELEDLVLKAGVRELEDDKFFKACAKLMRFIENFSKSPLYQKLQEKASTVSGEPSPWAELRHAAGRLLSYFQASKTLIEARKKWERLFHDFKVDFVYSSKQIRNPINDNKVNAEVIIGRMTGDETEMQENRAHAEGLQKFDLDLIIKKKAGEASFRPIVHAEVLVHQSIIDEFGPNGPRQSEFFEGYKYIGSSKPTCRLCDYYFTASATGLDVRETHRNLYINWRAPDVYSHQGGAAAKRRQQVLIRMLDRVREDAFRTLAEKVPERKTHDSNTDPTFPARNHGTSIGFDGGWGDADLEDVASSMGQLDVGESSGEDREVQTETPPARAASGFDGDDDDGGARL